MIIRNKNSSPETLEFMRVDCILRNSKIMSTHVDSIKFPDYLLQLQAPMSTQMENKQSLQEVANLMTQHRKVDVSRHPKPNPLLKPKQHLTGQNALPIPDLTVDNSKHPEHNLLSKTDQHDTVKNAPPISYFMVSFRICIV